jgi:hypothetical protein
MKARVKWPSLPTVTHGAGGPIRVRLVKRERDDNGKPCWGTWEPSTRTVRLERGAPPEHRWRVYYHECGHAMLDDAGLCHLLSEEGQEAFCDAYASSRMAELRGALG